MTNFDPQEAERLADELPLSLDHIPPRYGNDRKAIENAAAMLRAAAERVRELEAENYRSRERVWELGTVFKTACETLRYLKQDVVADGLEKQLAQALQDYDQ